MLFVLKKKQEPKKKKPKGNKQFVYVRAKEKTRIANTIPAPEDGTKMISTFIASDWLDPFHQDKIDRMGQFVYGSDDEGYCAEWEEFPVCDKFKAKATKLLRLYFLNEDTITRCIELYENAVFATEKVNGHGQVRKQPVEAPHTVLLFPTQKRTIQTKGYFGLRLANRPRLPA
ncbi:hypothetical protein R3P38DRAFT_2772233 [Favolaschia claudopus]|uniref:Uncharacterized protein n=1 Tax=Favolaschia claudopus TaxID=2862362 RepID=A0AAW0C370_9AGAR